MIDQTYLPEHLGIAMNELLEAGQVNSEQAIFIQKVQARAKQLMTDQVNHLAGSDAGVEHLASWYEMSQTKVAQLAYCDRIFLAEHCLKRTDKKVVIDNLSQLDLYRTVREQLLDRAKHAAR